MESQFQLDMSPALEPALSREPDPVLTGWSDFLQSYPWQWFVTVTSRNTVAPEALQKRFRLAVSMLNRQLFGRRVRHSDSIVWAIGEERHKNGNPHLHGVMYHRHDLNHLARRNDFRDLLQDLSGWSKVEKPRSAAGVTRYCSKYLAKEGEIFFSDSFGPHHRLMH